MTALKLFNKITKKKDCLFLLLKIILYLNKRSTKTVDLVIKLERFLGYKLKI